MLIFDANLSHELVALLSDCFPKSVHVRMVSLREAKDPSIWQYAKDNNLTVVTKDEDFRDLYFTKGFPPKVILIKRGNCPTKTIEAILRSNLDSIQKLLTDPDIGLLILK